MMRGWLRQCGVEQAADCDSKPESIDHSRLLSGSSVPPADYFRLAGDPPEIGPVAFPTRFSLPSLRATRPQSNTL